MDFLCRRIQKMEKAAGGIEPSKRRITVRIILDLCIWLTVSLPGLYLFLRGSPYERGFLCDDQSLIYPDVPETVSTPNLIIAGMSVSLFVVVLVEVFNCLDRKCRRTHTIKDDISHCINSYILFMIGVAVQLLIVEVIKNHMGELRPNFFQVCQPQYNRTVCPGFVTEYSCAGSDLKLIRSSRQSFPSGHASFSLFIALYFCIYMQRRLHVSYSRLLKFMLQCCLIFASVLCGLGRIKDFQHHPVDVAVGWVIGGAVAVFMSILVGRPELRKMRNESFTESSTDSLENGHACITKSCCEYAQSHELQNKEPSPLLAFRD